MTRRTAAALPLLVMLAGCGSLSEQFGGSVWVTPGKYAYHSCQRLIGVDQSYTRRLRELDELMARAAQGTGGQMVGQVVYRTEYQQALGERQAALDTMAQKRCQIESDRPSDRTVF